MITEIYLGFFLLAFAFLFYGYYTKNDLYRFMGSALIMILGAMLDPTINMNRFGNVEYISGTASVISGTTITVTNTYSVFESHVLGIFLAMAGAFSFYLIYRERRDVNT